MLTCPICDQKVENKSVLAQFNHIACPLCKFTWSEDFTKCHFTKEELQKYQKDAETDYIESEKLRFPSLMKQVPIIRIERQLRILYNERRLLPSSKKRKENKRTTMACPFEECRGFLNDEWTCLVCEKPVCNKCGQENDGHFECDSESKASFEMIRKETKNCPTCRAVIFKLSGCDQMWCTQCRTFFSWRTGIIDTSTGAHNPHYYEWMRRNNMQIPRNPLDIPNCEDMPFHLMREYNLTKSVWDLGRCLNDWGAHPHQTVFENELLSLRLQYLAGDLTETDWKIHLGRLETRRERNVILNQLCSMAVSVFRDHLTNLGNHKNPEMFLKDLDHLKGFFDESADKELKKMGSNMTLTLPYFNSIDK